MPKIAQSVGNAVSCLGRVSLFLPIAITLLYPTNSQMALASKLLSVFFCLVVTSFLRHTSSFALLIFILCVMYGSALWSMSPFVSLHGAIQLTYYGLIFCLFRSTKWSERSILWGIRLLVFIALVLSIEGLYQHISGYQDHLRYLEQHPGMLPPMLEQTTRDWITALSGRVFSRFALPSQFAGYLLMILPLNLLLILRVPSIWEKLLWGMGFGLNGFIFLYTKSFGAWLSLLCMLAIGGYLVISQKFTLTWRTLLKGSVVLLFGGWGILYVIGTIRGQYLWDLQGNNPLWYRFLNWKIAMRIFLDHPFLGTGLFTFGKAYPQYMLPGANESQYVHNSYLQLGTELGFIGFVLVGWLVLSWCVSVFKTLLTHPLPLPGGEYVVIDHEETPLLGGVSGGSAQLQYGLIFLFSGLAFLLHNLIDFDFYVFPLGMLGMALLALTLNMLSPVVPEPRTQSVLKRPRVLAGYGVICAMLVCMYVVDWQYSHSQQQQEQAIQAIQSGNYAEADTQIRKALRSAPGMPEYMALEGTIFTYLRQADAAIQAFQAAIQAEPATPWFHAGLAEAYLAQHNISLAYVESRRAAELFPQKFPYQQRNQEIRSQFSRISF
jgi:tetratricopeptide (TPR) repeat protein